MRPPASLVVTHNYLASRASARSIHPRNGWRNNCMPTRLKVLLVSYRQWHSTISIVFWMPHDMFAKCRCMAIPFSTVPARTQKAGSGEDLQFKSRKSRKPMCNKSHSSIAWVHVWSTFPGGPIFLGKCLPRAFNDPFFHYSPHGFQGQSHPWNSESTAGSAAQLYQKFVNLFLAKKYTVIFAQACSARLWEMQLPFSRSSRRSLMAYSRWILQFWASLGMWVFKGKVAKSALLLFVAFFCSWVLICILMGCFRKIELWTSLSVLVVPFICITWLRNGRFPLNSQKLRKQHFELQSQNRILYHTQILIDSI